MNALDSLHLAQFFNLLNKILARHSTKNTEKVPLFHYGFQGSVKYIICEPFNINELGEPQIFLLYLRGIFDISAVSLSLFIVTFSSSTK